MGLRYPPQTHCDCFFVTTTFKEHKRLGETDGLYDALAESLAFYSDKYQARIAGYVLMPSHFHLLLFIAGEQLGDFMRDLKKFVAQRVARQLKLPSGGIWMPRYDRVAIASEPIFRLKLNYIHNNPVKAGLVAEAAHWRWSSAQTYSADANNVVPVWKGWG